MPELKIFAAQFLMIWLLGIQSINVNRGYKLIAAISSFALGIVGFYVTGTVAAAYKDGMFTTMFLAFLCGGPCGIVFSIYTHPYIVKCLNRGPNG